METNYKKQDIDDYGGYQTIDVLNGKIIYLWDMHGSKWDINSEKWEFHHQRQGFKS